MFLYKSQTLQIFKGDVCQVLSFVIPNDGRPLVFQDLNCLIGRYLTPLQKESFLTQDEVWHTLPCSLVGSTGSHRHPASLLKHVVHPPTQLDVLFGNLHEMVEFQVEFLKTLEDGTRLVPDLEKLERVDQFKVFFFQQSVSSIHTHPVRSLLFVLESTGVQALE